MQTEPLIFSGDSLIHVIIIEKVRKMLFMFFVISCFILFPPSFDFHYSIILRPISQSFCTNVHIFCYTQKEEHKNSQTEKGF